MDEETGSLPVLRTRNGKLLVWGGIVGILAILVAAFVCTHDTLARSAITTFARSAGYALDLDALHIGGASASADGIVVHNLVGEPIFEARHIDLAYSLRDLLPGSNHRFGLESIDVAQPHLTLIHHSDGSYNVTLPKASKTPARPNTTPIDLRFRLRDGSIDIVDRFVNPAHPKHDRVAGLHADAVLSPVGRSYYDVAARLEQAGRSYPIRGRAKLDDSHGYEFQHWTAGRLPVALLTNFVLPNHAVTIDAGDIVGLDAKIAGLLDADKLLHFHMGITGDLEDGRISVASLDAPIRSAHGHFVVYDDGVSVPSLDATIGGVPLHLHGALYDFANPQLRFALHGTGDLARLKTISRQVAKMPLQGQLQLEGLAEGPASNPVVFSRFASSQIAYGAYVFESPHGLAAIQGQKLDVISSSLRYGALDVNAHAAIDLQRHVGTEAVATVSAPTDGLPYAGSIAPGMRLWAIAVASGVDSKLATRGTLSGTGGGSTLEAPFAIDENGVGDIALALDRADGASVFARVALDRRTNDVAAILDAHGLSLRPAPSASLPGLMAPAIPHIDGRLDMDLAATVHGSLLQSLGGQLHAYGSWGEANANADGTAAGVAATGQYRGSFERLQAFTGNIGAHGAIDFPFAVIGDGTRTTVQVANGRFDRASVRGIPIESVDATLALRPGAIDVIAANAQVAHHAITARGSFGNGGQVQLTAGDLNVHALSPAGSPARSGTATALAIVGGTFAKPTGQLLVAYSGGHYANAALRGDATLAFSGGTLRIDDATVGVGAAFAQASGNVSGLAPGRIAPRYDVRARLHDADIASIARTTKSVLRYPEGTLDAIVHVGGGGSTPTLDGSVQIPEGSLNGLSFRNATLALSGNTSDLTASGGRVTVGTSRVAFGGDATRSHQHVMLNAPHVNLADFNDYFDESDVLGGTGSIALAVDSSSSVLAANGEVRLRDARVRRFTLGTTNASVQTNGSTLHTIASIDGPNGRLALRGSIVVPQSNPLRDIVHRSYLDVTTRIAGVQLGTVLPALGTTAPVLGRIDGAATVRGRYPALSIGTNVALTNGLAGRVPIERLTIAATAVNGRGRVTDATLVTSAVRAQGDGRFGLRPTDALDLHATIAAPDIGALALLATGKNPGVVGALDARVNVRGTVLRPQLVTNADLSNVTYDSIVVPHAHADIAATRTAVDVTGGQIALQKGSIAFDGHVPFTKTANAPIAFDFAPRGVDVAPYSHLLPDHGVLAGVIDGNVSVRGSLATPELGGSLDFHNGSFHSSTLKSPLTAMELQLSFAGTQARIDRLHAHVAPGSIDGTGTIAVGDLRDPARNVRANVALTAKSALIDAPKFYFGFLDGTLTASKVAGAHPIIGGDLTVSNARIPYQAFIPSSAKPLPNAPKPPDIGFDLGLAVGKDVRVAQGPVDIGALGGVRLGGTLAQPTLDGSFSSTDGVVSFYRTLTLQPGSTVAFDPSNGVIPNLDATATTFVPDPATNVILRITGPATSLNLDFASDPSYSKTQIVGLLVNAQALGAISGVQTAQSAPQNSGSPITGITEGFINQQFARTFLKPLGGQLGSALGLQDLQLQYGLGGDVSAVARRLIGHDIAIQYGQTFGGQSARSSLGLSIGGEATSLAATFYSTSGSNAFGGQPLTPFLQSGSLQNGPINYALQAAEPPNGTSGFILTFQKKFK